VRAVLGALNASGSESIFIVIDGSRAWSRAHGHSVEKRRFLAVAAPQGVRSSSSSVGRKAHSLSTFYVQLG